MPRPAPAELPWAIWPTDVGMIAYQALLRDRVLVPVRGELAIPADVPATPLVRATALGPLVPDRCVVGRQAAVWIHTGAHEPARIDILVGPRRRRPDPHPDRVTHEAELAAEHIVLLGAVKVTSVQQTGLDIARWLPQARALEQLRSLSLVGFDAAAATRRLDELAGYAGIRAARRTLARLAGEQIVHERIAGSCVAFAPVSRYTSNTPSTLRTAARTEARCDGSAISNTNRDTATRSRDVDTDAERMFT